jgi:hypothetical protein
MKYGDRAVWSVHPHQPTEEESAWRSAYRTYKLNLPLIAIRLDAPGSRHIPSKQKIWFAIGAVSLPIKDYLAEYAVLNPSVVANVLGRSAVALDTWQLAKGSVVNIGVARMQAPFALYRSYFNLPGGAIQLELRPGTSPVFLGRELVTTHVAGG